MDYQELKNKMQMSLKGISEFFGIDYKTIQKWNTGYRTAPDYVIELMNYKWEHKDCNIVVERVSTGAELFEKIAISINAISEFFGIPSRTIYGWTNGSRTAPDYVISLMNYKWECENKKI